MTFRPSRPRRSSKQHDATDKQILLLHRAMAEKLLAEPWRINQIRQTLERRYQGGQLKHSGYIHWHSILDCLDQPELFCHALLDEGERMRKLRRRTVLVGILTEQERTALLYPLADTAANSVLCAPTADNNPTRK